MNREIKFRGQDLENKEWIYSNGFLKHRDGIIILCVEQRDSDMSTSPIVPETLGQFTGLIDTNGKDIYDGDVLGYTIFDFNDNDRQYKGIVKWFGSGFIVTQIPDGEGNGEYGIELFWVHNQDCELEIIGNIYEDKHLLDTK